MAPGGRRRSAPPPFDARPHLVHPDGAAAWFTEPPGVVLQLTEPVHGTVVLARWLIDDVVPMLRQRFGAETPIVVVIDLTLMTGRDLAARAVLHTHARSNRRRIARVVVVPPSSASALVVNALHVGTAVLNTFGLKVDLETSLEAALATCGLRSTRFA